MNEQQCYELGRISVKIKNITHKEWVDHMIDTRPGFFPDVGRLWNVSHISSSDNVYSAINMYGLSKQAKQDIDAWIDDLDDLLVEVLQTTG